MPPTKRQRLSDDEPSYSGSDLEGISTDGELGSGQSEPDTEDEIAEAKLVKSKKTSKRKRRATDATNFGATLQSLLTTNAPAAPLSLKPSVAKKRKEEKLEAKGKQVLQVERKEKEDRGRITDIIGGWGGESERALRKVAQRGVVKLFNAIQQSQAASAAAAADSKSHRGTGRPSLPAPAVHDKKKKGKQKDNVIGRGKDTTLAQDDFLELIRSGGIPPQQKAKIFQEEWERRLHDVQVSKDDLNRLVMDYLVIEGYKSAAEEFSKETSLESPTDFNSIENRMRIREALQRGDVGDAITRVNDLDPEILDTNPSLYFRLQQQKLIEYIRQGKIAEALHFAQEELAPRGEESPEFLSELERTMALLAFESSPLMPSTVSELLSPAQRMRTAAEVNAAILESLGQGKEAKLVGLLRLMFWGEDMLEERAEMPKKLIDGQLDLNDGTFGERTSR
ncbi:CTLH/CRA C-terminal to lish motif domain-containing protein [Epithele typhae]|uniref:CTLH/CRA C-terminal to lish motif domain-containing protein n=1 Tax=Epithele typhae TaxID=378194 RepID=UPI0020079B47|nr:CTLH/CRA C-terminal to lish motif domain-containing protein [Epithele typhae]KAH9944152.1 CTLH/CRA C-terminal to lish motif domain-containing protein [Epithele typhae]